MFKKKKKEIHPEYKRFFEDFYKHFMATLHEHGMITKSSIKKSISDFAMSRHLLYEIKMTRAYRKSIESQLMEEIKKQKELKKQQEKLQKEQKKRNLIEGLI